MQFCREIERNLNLIMIKFFLVQLHSSNILRFRPKNLKQNLFQLIEKNAEHIVFVYLFF
jgi:hypothetical protein